MREYEAACEDAGAQAGIVDLTTFNVINAVLAGPAAPAGRLAARARHARRRDDGDSSRGRHLVFFRNRIAEGEASLADMVHQTAMYYEDRLSGAGFSRVVLAGGGLCRRDRRRRTPTICGARSSSGSMPRSTPSIRGSAANLMDRITASAELLDALAPLVGLMARERAA